METRPFGCGTETNILTGCEGDVYERLKVEPPFCDCIWSGGKFYDDEIYLTLQVKPSVILLSVLSIIVCMLWQRMDKNSIWSGRLEC
jgi:hypothetical protein